MQLMSEILSIGLPRGFTRNKNGVRPEGSFPSILSTTIGFT